MARRGGPVAEGNVGGGTGMSCLGFKCGTGTASRVVEPSARHVHGRRAGAGELRRARPADHRRCAGRPGDQGLRAQGEFRAAAAGEEDAGGRGSIIAIAATDAPLVPHQLRRIAQRISLGVGRTGGTAGNGSGDIFLAFSTANKGAAAAAA